MCICVYISVDRGYVLEYMTTSLTHNQHHHHPNSHDHQPEIFQPLFSAQQRSSNRVLNERGGEMPLGLDYPCSLGTGTVLGLRIVLTG